MADDLIAALATPAGRGALAIIRVDGSGLSELLRKLFTENYKKLMPRRATRCWLELHSGFRADCLSTFFQAPHSYTGNDLLEISLHANPLLIEEVLRHLLNLGCRLAEPGEFSLRALLNGKMDLLQAEAVNELVNAVSLVQIQKQQENLRGRLSCELQKLKNQLLELSALTEASLEFDAGDERQLKNTLERLALKLENIYEKNLHFLSRQRSLKLVIAGLVNSGKSSLFNALLDHQRAIISSRPGTTRDYLEEELSVQGVKIKLVDIAGFDFQTDDELELEGIRRSWQQIQEADALIYLIDGSQPLQNQDLEILEKLKKKRKLILINKTDIAAKKNISCWQKKLRLSDRQLISAKNGTNLEIISEFVRQEFQLSGDYDDLLLLNFRQLEAFSRIVKIIKQVQEQKLFFQPELLAEELRLALSEVDQLMGKTVPDDVLNRIFSSFCVGK